MTDPATPLGEVDWLASGMADTLALADVHTVADLAKGAALSLAPIGWPAGAIEAAKRLRDELDDGTPPLDPTTPLTLIEWFPARAVEHFKEVALDTLAAAAMADHWDGTRIYPAWPGWRKLARRCRDEQGRWLRARDREDARRKRDAADAARDAARSARLDALDKQLEALGDGLAALD